MENDPSTAAAISQLLRMQSRHGLAFMSGFFGQAGLYGPRFAGLIYMHHFFFGIHDDVSDLSLYVAARAG